MAKIDKKAVELLKAKAAPASIIVTEVKGLQEALDYALELCEKKEACELLLSGCEQKLSDKAAEVCERAANKVIAAPALDEKDFAGLVKKGEAKGFTVIKNGMRDHLAGIDVGFTVADKAIAETATSVLVSDSEELRLATMMCEIHVMALPKSKVVSTSYEAEEFLQSLMKEGPAYTAFISGASRTADIERVLAIGVHGPLELHIALMEE